MPDYDPINLRPYQPSDTITLREYHKRLVDILCRCKDEALQRLASEIGSSHSMYPVIEDWIATIHNADGDWGEYMQKSGWEMVWDQLLSDQLVAYVLDNDLRMHGVDREFWTTQYALPALSSGKIDKIPLYTPNGIVLIEEGAAIRLFAQHKGTFSDLYAKEILYVAELEKASFGVVDFKSEFDKIFVKSRGRKSTYDVKTLLIETARMILAGDIPDGKHGSKKAWLGRLRRQYEQVRGFNDLPSDDTISREIRPIFDERRGQPALQEPELIGQSSG